jgi:hypothetical protein
MKLGPEVDAKGGRLIWIERVAFDRITALRAQARRELQRLYPAHRAGL